MTPPGRFRCCHRAAALTAVLALALPPPLWAAPDDQMRVNQAAGAQVGLEELPRAFDRPPARRAAGGLEEPYRGSLASLVATAAPVSFGGQGYYPLPRREWVPIPLAAWQALGPQERFLIYLGQQGDFVMVERPAANGAVRLLHSISETVMDLRVGQIIDVGRAPTRAAQAPQRRSFVLPSASDAVAPWHAQVRLDGGAGQAQTLALHALSDTYLRVSQAQRMLYYMAADGSAPPWAWMKDVVPIETWARQAAPQPATQGPGYELPTDRPVTMPVWALGVGEGGLQIVAQGKPLAIMFSEPGDSAVVVHSFLEEANPIVPIGQHHTLDGVRYAVHRDDAGIVCVSLQAAPLVKAYLLPSQVRAVVADAHRLAWYLAMRSRLPAGAILVHRDDALREMGSQLAVNPGGRVMVHHEFLQSPNVEAGRDFTWLPESQVRAAIADGDILGIREVALTQLVMTPPYRRQIVGAGLEEETTGEAEGANETLDVAIVKVPETPSSLAFNLEMTGWHMRFEQTRGITVRPEFLDATAEVIDRALAMRRPWDLVIVDGHLAGGPIVAARARLQQALDLLAPRADRIRAPIVVVTAAPAEEAARDAVVSEVRALNPPSHPIMHFTIPEGNPHAMGELIKWLDRTADAVLDQRRGGLPKGSRIFSAKTLEFSALAAAMVYPHDADLAESILRRREPFDEAEGGGAMARRILEVLGGTTPVARHAVWQLEETLRSCVVRLDVRQLSVLLGDVGGAFGQTTLLPDAPMRRAVIRAIAELHQLQIRAELVEDLRVFNHSPATPGQRWHVTAGFRSTEAVPGYEVTVSIAPADSHTLTPWERRMLTRLAVRVTYRPPSGAGQVPRSVKRSLTVDEDEGFALVPLTQFGINVDELQQAWADQRLRVEITGPGLPEAETGLEEPTVEQAARTQADPSLSQYD